MSKVNGHGGWWVKEVPEGTSQSQRPVIHNAEYEVETAAEAHECRSAGCGGWTEGLPVVRRVEHATMRVAEDDVAYPQALGLTEGAELTLWLKRGALAQYDKVEKTIVATVRVVNDQKKARWVEITCRHGRYTRGVPAPL